MLKRNLYKTSCIVIVNILPKLHSTIVQAFQTKFNADNIASIVDTPHTLPVGVVQNFFELVVIVQVKDTTNLVTVSVLLLHSMLALHDILV